MNETEIQELRARLRGELKASGDAAYEAARKVYNGMIDRRPALIARCTDLVDVKGAYRDDYARLAPVRSTTFRVNQYMKPAAPERE